MPTGIYPRKPVEDRFFCKVKKSFSCWIFTGHLNNKGYGYFAVDGKKILAHRFSFELHKKRVPVGLCVLHRCDVPPCVNPSHLFLGTKKDNTQDMFSKGRNITVRGEENGKSKLSSLLIKKMRRAYSSGNYTQRGLARDFGISHTTAWMVLNNKTWKHV